MGGRDRGQLAVHTRNESYYRPLRPIAHCPKANGTANTIQLVSTAGLAQWFEQSSELQGRVWAASLQQAFETFSVRVSPWGDTVAFRPRRVESDPRRVVKETGSNRTVARDLSRWLLRRESHLPWSDPSFQVWAELSATTLMRSLASEIVDGVLLFRGPPTKRLDQDAEPLRTLDRQGFALLQDCALWVAENEREHEARHSLFAMNSPVALPRAPRLGPT